MSNVDLSTYIHYHPLVVCNLQEANKLSNRDQRPWIITMGHKPMYCSNDDKPDEMCNNVDRNRVIN